MIIPVIHLDLSFQASRCIKNKLWRSVATALAKSFDQINWFSLIEKYAVMSQCNEAFHGNIIAQV